ncbi:MAG TPA: hypothetical protein VJH90_03735 [archaeon]|nr:hypothetical protein [archaeon]
MHARRVADQIEGPNKGYMEIGVMGSGDIVVEVQGTDKQGEPSYAQVQFLTGSGGGWHPRTMNALYRAAQAFQELAKAMEEDNKDPDNPRRYRQE